PVSNNDGTGAVPISDNSDTKKYPPSNSGAKGSVSNGSSVKPDSETTPTVDNSKTPSAMVSNQSTLKSSAVESQRLSLFLVILLTLLH
ncbi:hypothetical protein BC833DRAFT_625849, partial [Globomyces pollinis-pini]